MTRSRIARGFKFFLIAAVALLAFGFAVMLLWNWLLPAIAGWHEIGFLQAIGLLALARILFGGLRGHGHGHWRHRMRERWAQMTPEQREQFRAGLHEHCHHGAGRDAAAP